MSDAFERDIIGLLDASGALKSEASAQKLVELLSRAGDGAGKAKELALVVLRRSASHPSCLAAFVKAGGLKHLRHWLRAIQKAGSDDTGVSREILRALDVLPLDFPTLQSSEIGKPVARMSSSRGGAEKFTKDSRNTTDIVSLADGLVAKWSKLVPEDAVAPSKKRKSAVTDPASVAPTPAKAKRPLVSSDDVPAHGSPSLPAVLPELTSLSSLAQEAMSSAKGKTPSPSAPSTAPTFGANGRRIVLSSPASAVAVSADVLVPGEGDPSAYGDKENGVLINPVRQVVGGHKRERGRRGGIRFPEKDDDLRLIRWFLRTDEPTKVSDMAYQPVKGSVDLSTPGDDEVKSFDRALESRSEQFHDVKDLLRSHVEIDDEGHVSSGAAVLAQIAIPITPRFSFFPTTLPTLTPSPFSRRVPVNDIPSSERTYQMERTACAFRVSQSLVPVVEQIAILDPEPSYIPPDFVEYEPTDDAKCRYCNFLMENQQLAQQPNSAAPAGGLLPLPPPAPVPQPTYHDFAYPEVPPQYYAEPAYPRDYYGAPAPVPAYASYPPASTYPPVDPYGYPTSHYPPPPHADDYARYRDARPVDPYSRPPEPQYHREYDDRSREPRRDAPRQPLWPSSKPQLRPASERHCVFFHSGTCRNGTACSFIHDPNHRLTPEDYPVGRR